MVLGEDTAAKKARKKDDFHYVLDYRTRWSDNDVYDHMNNSMYSLYIDSIVNAYLIEECGMNPRTSDQVGLVVNTYCDYFGSVEYPWVLELGLRVIKLGRSSVKYEVGIFKKGEDVVRAVGGSTHVFVDSKTRKPGPSGMPENIRQGLSRLLEKDAAKL